MLGSLRKKINFAFIIITLLCMLSMSFLSLYQTTKIAESQMKNDGETIVSLVNKHMASYDVDKDLDEITKVLQESKGSSNDDIVYISVIDTQCKIIAHDDDTMVGKSSDRNQFSKVLDEGKVDGFMSVRPTGDKVYNVSMPLKEQGKVVGAVSVGLSLEDMKSVTKREMILTTIISLIILAIAVVTADIVSYKISRPLVKIKNKIMRLGEGDFTVSFHVKSSDEIGDLMATLSLVVSEVRDMMLGIKEAIENLDDMSNNLSASSEEVAASSEGVAKAVVEVSDYTTGQNDRIENMKASLEEFGKSLDLIDDKLASVAHGSEKIKISADIGTGKLENLVSSIDEMREEFGDTEKRIGNLNENVDKISEITYVINSVAEQTNLLALNAAIEAARAGESGRGFSVVADEIRKLAEQVLESSKSINDLISTVVSNAENVSIRTKEVSNKMENQIEFVKETVESLKDIMVQVEEISPQIDNVYETLNSSVEQKDNLLEQSSVIASLSEQITSSSQEISATVEEQNSTTEELSASAEELKNTADTIADVLKKFKI